MTKPHDSPNGSEPGSIMHAAEAWMLAHNYSIPSHEHSHLVNGMLDQFIGSPEFKEWESDDL